MTDTHQAISAFLDDEVFEPAALANALSDPEGRALLIDLLALRHLSQPEQVTVAKVPSISPIRAILAIAAVLLAMVGGYAAGQRRSTDGIADAPAATRVVEVPASWQIAPVRR